jgi:putative ABC transport system permease protein
MTPPGAARLLNRLPGETWKIALAALNAHKMRAALSMIGVVIGSASLVLVVTAGLTGGRYILEQIEGVGSNLTYAELRHTGGQTGSLSDEMTSADLDAVQTQIPGIAAVAGSRDLPMTVVVNGAERAVTVIGVTPGFAQIRHLIVTRGRYFDAEEMRTGAKVCLLTEELAGAMFSGADPTGAVARVGDLRLTVIGVFRERVSTFGASEVQRESVLVPLQVLKNFTGTEYIRVLYAQSAESSDVPEVTRAVGELLRSRHRAGARYQVENLTGLLSAAQRISSALTITLLVVALIALTVSGIGIMNVMLVTVTERTREIGIRKAVGAPRRSILSQFLIEAAIISGVGAIGGVALAVGLLLLIRSFLPAGITLPISGLSVLASLVASASVGLVFGYLPARRAATLQPVDALRYE